MARDLRAVASLMPESSPVTGPSRNRLYRLLALGLALVALVLVGELTGLRKSIDVAHLRELVAHAGAAGVFVFFGVFVIGELLHIPGLMFVAVGVTIWGRVWGGVIGWTAALLSIAISFLVIRALSGPPGGPSRWRFIQRMVDRLETHPVQTTALLRAIVMAAPTVTCILALTRVRFSRMLLGSAIGLFPPVVLVTVFVTRALKWFAH